jgi:hypothetical protein
MQDIRQRDEAIFKMPAAAFGVAISLSEQPM